MKRMLDLFCGRFGWSRAFAARGWECVGVDLVEPAAVPQGCRFIHHDVLELDYSPKSGLLWYGNHQTVGPFDFICASSPCEEFSVHGMKHFHPNPKYPENGIRLFNHTREICEASGVPYVMENVRAAQQFVGRAVHHCGPFYLWGTGVPPLMPQGISKGFGAWNRAQILATGSSKSKRRIETQKAKSATIPPELAFHVADYAEIVLDNNLALG